MALNSARLSARNSSRQSSRRALTDEQLNQSDSVDVHENDVIDETELVLSEEPGHRLYLPYLAVKAAVDQKGLDVRAVNVSNCTNIADVFVIASATSDRHVESLSDKIRAALAVVGEHPHGSSGYENSQWVILDYGNLVVHIFYEPTRQHYRFDELWQRGAKLKVPASLEHDMRMLRTGMYR